MNINISALTRIYLRVSVNGLLSPRRNFSIQIYFETVFLYPYNKEGPLYPWAQVIGRNVSMSNKSKVKGHVYLRSSPDR